MTRRPGRPWSRLPEVVRQKVLESWREREVDDEWASFTVDDLTTMAGYLGYRGIDPHWGIGGGQGDGACFTGEWHPELCEPNRLKDAVGEGDPLLEIANRFIVLLVATKVSGNELPTFEMKLSGRYRYEHNIEFEFDAPGATDCERTVLKDLSHDLMRWFFRNLQQEYDHVTSDDYLVESIEANDYHFNFAGDIV